MVLSSATTEDSNFGSSDSDDAYNTSSSAYPPHPPITRILGLSSGTFSDAAKERFIQLQLAVAEREFGFRPSAVEHEGLAYYNAVFYAAESKGSLYGTLAGGAIGALMTRRQRNVGFLFRGIGNRLGVQPKWQLLASRLTNFAFITAVGRLWGITSYGVQAFNQTAKMQREDPNMKRYLEARDRWLAQRQKEGRAGVTRAVMQVGQEAQRARERQQQDEGDPQSLGGVDFYEDRKPADGSASGVVEDSGETRRISMEAKVGARRKREADAENVRQRANERHTDDDPFFGDSEQTQSDDSRVVRARQNNNSQGGSAWDRLRRGEQGDAANRDDSTASAWPRRSAMKGFEQSEAKEDSFSFSTGDRERAKEEAQRLFDERVEKERRGEGRDGFAKEVNHNREGRQ
ncbi:hypothetical protein BZA05DRAFT_402214 [Tricharina praecox]|uniref:uncharacterized protein n=1 Tax=Tricharina praecox TaxID=43433 RepID=UPI00221F71E6|nr:uncharacterized protein BZA05DRAFT_402214 [Tricharina praecox]KAI5849101.1 hypothetical protein BZA05DRAFT_402214 [Tricharina praecox]